jgi:outer membrane protein assembly factor BamB
MTFGARCTLLAWLIVGTMQSADATAGEWPTFRGTDRTAVSKETNLLQSWPEGGPPLVWKCEGTGRGYTSLAIQDQRIYLVGDGIADVEDQDEYLLCHDRQTGKRVWATRLGAPWKSGSPTWQSSRSTPTVDGDRVYALTANGDLVCCETANGAILWRKNLKSDFGGKKADGWGYSESVLIDGDRLICTPGGEANTVVALDKRTGETVWTTVNPGDRGAGHGSVAIATIGGVREYVQVTGSGVLGIRAEDGKLLWSYPFDRTTAVAATPIVRDDLIFFAVGYRRGGALLRQSADGMGGVTVSEVYPLNSALSNKHGGVVVVGDYVFGDSEDGGIPYCADLMTGEIVWKKRGSGRGSIAVAAGNGCLYFHFADGTMVLAKADPAGYEEVGSFKVPNSGQRPSWAHPVILDGKLYLREHDAILCFDIEDRSAKN